MLVDAGETLGRLGDPRNLEKFVLIKGGDYPLEMGMVAVKSFEMAAYPVTNKWFASFVDAGNYKNTEYWTQEGQKWLSHTGARYPAYWHSRKWNCPNSPVVGVSWWEADAFCRWLTCERNDGFVYRLPSEGEWEAAAAGFKQRKYPFGKWRDGVCNTDEAKIEKTSPVGIFKNGKTPEGLFDMAGNVWEWTTSNYDLEKDVEDFAFDREIAALLEDGDYSSAWEVAEKKKIRSLLRGGSWIDYRSLARCAIRVRDFPLNRFYNIGFRCARTVK